MLVISTIKSVLLLWMLSIGHILKEVKFLVLFSTDHKETEMSKIEYSTSVGTRLFDRGPRNMVPVHNYLAGTGKSLAYEGPGYYVPSERRWVSHANFRSLPRQTRRDCILFESEEDWRTWQARRDKEPAPSGRDSTEYNYSHPSGTCKSLYFLLNPFKPLFFSEKPVMAFFLLPKPSFLLLVCAK